MLLLILYFTFCLLISILGNRLHGFTSTQSVVIKFFSNFTLTPIFGWIVIRILNLRVDSSIDKEICKELKE